MWVDFIYMDLLSLYQQLLNKFGYQYWWPVVYSQNRIKDDNLINNHYLENGLVYGIKDYNKLNSVNYNVYLEIILGAILTQNTNWSNVAKVLINLDKKNLFNINSLLKIDLEELGILIKSSGYYRQKAKKIKIFVEYLHNKYQDSIEKMSEKTLPLLRQELLGLWGIGPETADSILLYAFNKPIFVVDAYTKRLLKMYNLEFKTYSEYQSYIQNNIPLELLIYKEFHALIVKNFK